MNIFKFEFNKTIKQLMIFGLIIILIFIIFMSSLYPTFLSTKDEITNLLNNFPDIFLTAFGIDIETIFSFRGFYSFVFMYIGLIFAILGAIEGVSLFGEEKHSNCEEFLFCKPRKKSKIYFIKLLVGFVDVIIINVIYMAVYLILMYRLEGSIVYNNGLLCILLSPLLIQLMFLFLGAVYATVSKKIKSLNNPGVIIGLGGFLLTIVYSSIDKPWASFISPLDYFGVSQVIATNGYHIYNIIYGLILMTLSFAISYYYYTVRDVRS